MNIAAIYSRLAGMEDRSQAEGMKRAIAHYQVGYRACLVSDRSRIVLNVTALRDRPVQVS
jgi:hypothetical protein